MKKLLLIITGAVVLLLVACGPKKVTAVENCFTAIDRYLADSIGTQYLHGEICIPFHSYASVDETSQGDIQVLGDFWVMNYNVVGDTLMTVSGGSHPGKMHVRRNGDGHFEVTSFEPVLDGSEFLPSAKRIFGDQFDEFQAAYSNEKAREHARKEGIAAYVAEHEIPVKVYQDYGWPAVRIPTK